ncbi:hypothetical protein [Mycobacterium sp. GA-2829]|nr:hypothetical protein [Mycobacterium sp. GA-2829]
MHSSPITVTGRLLRQIRRAVDAAVHQTPDHREPCRDEVEIVERELTRC